jgi:hypothetical protein
VPGAVELVHIIEIPPSLFGLLLDLKVRVYVPVRLLGGRYEIDKIVAVLLQLGVFAVVQCVGGAFDDLVYVRIVEEVSLVLAFLLAGGDFEVAYSPRGFALVQNVGQSGLGVNIDTLVPKAAGNTDLLKPHGLDRSGLEAGGAT